MDDVGEYHKGDTLKSSVDPRTYAYLRRVFGIAYSEEKYSK